MAHHTFAFKHKIGGPTRYIENKEAICLTNDQASHVYKKGRIIQYS